MARWYPAGTLDASMWDDPPEEWWNDGESGEQCSPPYDAWWEESVEIEETRELEDVTHWHPMLKMPQHPYTQNDQGVSVG